MAKNVLDTLPWDLINSKAAAYKIPNDVVAACIMTESNGNTWAIRFEPGWKYSKDITVWAKKLGLSTATEKNAQMTSWGLMQVMGTVCRELGFGGHLASVCTPEIGIDLGCKKLKKCMDRYKGNTTDAIAAFNAGTMKKLSNGKYSNQDHIDRYLAHLKKVQAYLKA